MQALGGALGGIFGGAGRGAGRAIRDRGEQMSISEAMDVSVVARKAAELGEETIKKVLTNSA
jgi:hypothetical protein